MMELSCFVCYLGFLIVLVGPLALKVTIFFAIQGIQKIAKVKIFAQDSENFLFGIKETSPTATRNRPIGAKSPHLVTLSQRILLEYNTADRK